MDHHENLLRVVRFENPDYIPMDFHINPSCWHHYPQDALQELMKSHQMLFPEFKKTTEKIQPEYPVWAKAGDTYVDGWGCTLQTTEDGIAGTAIKNPLAKWEDFENFIPPDPEKNFRFGPANWEKIAKNPRKAKHINRLENDGLQHGHTFLTLVDIRGYENLLFDMFDDNQNLHKLIEMVENYNLEIVKHYLKLGAEWMSYPEDLGMQTGPMITPDQFRKFIKPTYQRIIEPARKAGCIIHMHSDGDIRSLVEDIIEGGVEAINMQDMVNGIDWIKDNLKGKVCIDLDIDRQNITRFGTPDQIDALIREEVEKIGSKQGGLMMIYGLYADIPLKNIKALMDAMEKYATFYS